MLCYVYTVYLWLVEKLVVGLVAIGRFSPALTVEALWADGRNCDVRKREGHFARKFQGVGVVHQRLLVSEN